MRRLWTDTIGHALRTKLRYKAAKEAGCNPDEVELSETAVARMETPCCYRVSLAIEAPKQDVFHLHVAPYEIASAKYEVLPKTHGQ